MSVKIVQKSIKFLSELVNGSNFDENLTQTTPTLTEGVTGRCKAISEIEVTVGMNISNFQILLAGAGAENDTNPYYKIVKDDAQFTNEGFTIGSKIALTFDDNGSAGPNPPFFTCYFIVTAVLDTTLMVTYNGLGTGNDDITLANLFTFRNFPSNINGDYKLYSNPGYIAIEPNFTALEYSYNLVENDDSTSFVSRLTNTTNITKVKGIPTTPNATIQTGVATSKNKAWVMGGVTAEFKDKVFNDNAMKQLKFSNLYEITHEFTIPYFYDGENNFLEDTTTSPDLYNGSSSPKYIYKTIWYTDINNPNTGSIGVYDSDKGAAPFFDESGNGDENPYTIENLFYLDAETANSVDKLQIGKKTKVGFFVSNSDNDFTTTQKAVLAHGAILDSTDYESSTLDFDNVWSFETLRHTAGPVAGAGVIFSEFKIFFLNSGSISVQFDVEFTPYQNTVLEENQYYVLSLQLRNDLETNVSNSHKVPILIDYNQYGKNNDIDGLFGVTKFEQVPHPLELEPSINDTIGYTNGQFDIEEGGVSVIEFWLDNSKDAVLEDLSFDISVYDTSTGNKSVLRNTTIDISNSVLVGKNQQISLDETVGYPLKDGDIFNFKKLITGDLVGSKQFYTLAIGYKIPWQKWLEFKDAPTSFFDFNKEHNGLNQKTSNYSDVGNYQIRFFVNATVSQFGINTDYQSSSENINVYNYDEDDSVLNNTYTCTIGTFDENDVSIEDNIIQDGYTKIKSTFTPLVPPVFSKSVDMTEVSTIWSRYAHGNKFQVATFNRLPNWDNDQADDVDVFTGFNNSPSFTKNSSSLYVSTPSTILAQENMNAVYGCYSIDTYEYYSINGTMFSTSVDDDVIKFDLAFHVDSNGIEHTLSLCATSGGVVLDINPSFNPNDITSQVFYFPNNPSQEFCNVALVYNYGKRDALLLDSFFTTEVRDSWSNVGDCKFDASRSMNDITVDIDWLIKGNQFNHTFNYNLNDNPQTVIFAGAKPIGFSFFSQDQGGFKDVNLIIPEADFWSAVRIETEQDGSDNGLFELSNDIEGDSKNLLKQLNGDLILSSNDWDGTSFIVQSLVNTTRISKGELYKISAEIGGINLGAINLLSSFAWVDSSDRTKLYVKFNTSLNLPNVTTTGLTINGVLITGFVLAESLNSVAVFTLDTEILEGYLKTFSYDITNTIKSLDNSLSLGNGSIEIYDI